MKPFPAVAALAALSFFCFGALAAPEPRAPDGSLPSGLSSLPDLEPSRLHVRVMKKLTQSTVEVSHQRPLRLEVFDPDGGSPPKRRTLREGPWKISLKGRHMEVKLPGQTLRAAQISLFGFEVLVDGEPMPKRMDFVAGQGGLQVIYHVPMEDYVARVLPHEMSLSWPEEALKAQAIAIRTYAYYQMHSRRGQLYHLQASVQDQVFKWKLVAGGWGKKLQNIIDATRGQILRSPSGAVASIFYHADCGGSAEKTPWVWGQQGPTPPIRCPHHASPTWSLTVSAEEMATRLRNSRVRGAIKEVTTKSRAPSGRVQGLGLQLASGEVVELKPEDFRRMIGYNRLKSTKFTAHKVAGGFEFVGTGHGHGVGLCQHGSKAWAARGKSGREILKIYYPNLELSVLTADHPAQVRL